MKGYKIVLPPKDENGGFLIGRGVHIYTPEGHEVTMVGDFEIDVTSGDFAMLKVSVPVGEIVHAQPEGEVSYEPLEVTTAEPKKGDISHPKYREYGDLS